MTLLATLADPSTSTLALAPWAAIVVAIIGIWVTIWLSQKSAAHGMRKNIDALLERQFETFRQEVFAMLQEMRGGLNRHEKRMTDGEKQVAYLKGQLNARGCFRPDRDCPVPEDSQGPV